MCKINAFNFMIIYNFIPSIYVTFLRACSVLHNLWPTQSGVNFQTGTK